MRWNVALASVFFAIGLLIGTTPALATHYYATVTWPINNVNSIGDCHGNPWYFTESGWARSCLNAKDIG